MSMRLSESDLGLNTSILRLIVDCRTANDGTEQNGGDCQLLGQHRKQRPGQGVHADGHPPQLFVHRAT